MPVHTWPGIAIWRSASEYWWGIVSPSSLDSHLPFSFSSKLSSDGVSFLIHGPFFFTFREKKIDLIVQLFCLSSLSFFFSSFAFPILFFTTFTFPISRRFDSDFFNIFIIIIGGIENGSFILLCDDVVCGDGRFDGRVECVVSLDRTEKDRNS